MPFGAKSAMVWWSRNGGGVMQHLKNLSMIELPNGAVRLYDDSGRSVDVFNRYHQELRNRYPSTATRSAYGSAVAHFLDYLYEAGILGSDMPPTEKVIATAISGYPDYLTRGSTSSNPYIANLAKRLNREPLSQVGPAIAAINLFLELAVDWAAQDKELLVVLKGAADLPSPAFLSELSRVSRISQAESWRIQQNSIIGGNLRKIGAPPKSKRVGIRSPRSPRNGTDKVKDFPVSQVVPMIRSASNIRDRLFYSLLAATGLRESEAISLPIDLINIADQSIRIEDPNGWRGSQQYLPKERLSYKGRNTAKVYIISHIKSLLFEYLYDYLQVRPVTNHNYLFVKMTNKEWGKPFFETTNRDRNEAFRRAQIAAGITPSYTLHSLRHFYGVFLKNYMMLPGRSEPGLSIEEVQLLMGHESLRSTLKYAKTKQEILISRMEMADKLIQGECNIDDLPSLVAKQYRAIADSIENPALNRANGRLP